MAETLRATLATIARFHSFALARELQFRGMLTAIYTGLARPIVRGEGIEAARIRAWPWLQTPIEAGQKLGIVSPLLARRLAPFAHRALDRHVARTLPDCDAYVALSGTGLESGRAAQARGIAYLCDRSSAHIVVQDRLLREEHDALGLDYVPVNPRTVDRELGEYEQADAIVVPSAAVERSFLEMGIPAGRLRRVPLGVDLSRFAPGAERDESFTVLFVGQPGIRKGFHYLLQGFARAELSGARLVAVGEKQPETDTLLKRFPVPSVELTGPVDGRTVVDWMSRASVLVLPSLEDGFGMVQMEAMACGCPVITSANAGCADFLHDGKDGFVVPARDAEAIADRLTRLHDDPDLRDTLSAAGIDRVRAIGGWRQYGDAMEGAIRDVVEPRTAHGDRPCAG